MVTQFKTVLSQDPVHSVPSSLLFNTALVVSLRELVEQAVRHIAAVQPKVLCLGENSTLIPDLVAHCSPRALSFQTANRAEIIQQQDTFEVVILLTDEKFTLNAALLNQIKRCLTPQGRLIIVTPYQAGFVRAVQRSFGVSFGHHSSPSNVFSVKALFQRLSAEGFSDPYLKLIGGLPGFWQSVACSVTPEA